jgi:hypothetical protein
MLLRRVLIALVLQHGKSLDQFLPRFPRLDNGIDKFAVGGDGSGKITPGRTFTSICSPPGRHCRKAYHDLL